MTTGAQIYFGNEPEFGVAITNGRAPIFQRAPHMALAIFAFTNTAARGQRLPSQLCPSSDKLRNLAV